MPYVRGLSQWLDENGWLHRVSTSLLKDCVLGVDALRYFMAYLPRNPWCTATGHVDQEAIDAVVKHHMKLFERHSVTPIFVFPGTSAADTYPIKSISSENISQLNNEDAVSRDRAWIEFRRGATDTAKQFFSDVPFRVTSAVVTALRRALQAGGAKVIVAPYSVGPQLSWLSQMPQSFIHAAYGGHELLLMCVERTVLSLNLEAGVVEWVELSEIFQATGLSHPQLVSACLLAGYDGATTFPLCYEGNRFAFENAICLVDEFKTLQGVLDAFAFKISAEKLKLVKEYNSVLDEFECCRVLVPGGVTAPLRSVRSARLTTTSSSSSSSSSSSTPSASPASSANASTQTCVPARALPNVAYSMLAAGALDADLVASVTTGLVVDPVFATRSKDLEPLLDYLNQLRANALALVQQSIRRQDSADKKADASSTTAATATSSASASVSSTRGNLGIVNARAADEEEGVWPRELSSSIDQFHGDISQLESQLKVFASLASAFVAHEAKTSMDNTNTFEPLRVLQWLAKQNGSTFTSDGSASSDSLRALLATASLVSLFALGFVSETGSVTRAGEAMVSAYAKLISSANADPSADAALLFAVVLARGNFFDARMMTVVPGSADSGTKPYHYGQGSSDADAVAARVASRVAAMFPFAFTAACTTSSSTTSASSSISASSLTAADIDEDLVAFSVGAGCAQAALRHMFQASLLALLTLETFSPSLVSMQRLAMSIPFSQTSAPSAFSGSLARHIIGNASSSSLAPAFEKQAVLGRLHATIEAIAVAVQGLSDAGEDLSISASALNDCVSSSIFSKA